MQRWHFNHERWQRWRLLPRFIGLLWHTGWRDLLLLTSFAVLRGLLPVLVVLILQVFVDTAVDALEFQTSLLAAFGWAAALFGINLLNQGLATAQRWLGDDIQERLKAHVQAQLLQVAYQLPLELFEQPAFYDQLHRAQRGLDRRLFTTINQLTQIPTTLITIFGLTIYLAGVHVFVPLLLMVGLIPLILQSMRYYATRYILEKHHSSSERMVRYLEKLLTSRVAAAEVRVFNLRDSLLERWEKQYTTLRQERTAFARKEATMLLRRTVFDRFVVGIVLVFVIAAIALGRVSLGYFTSYLSAIDQLTSAFYNLLWSLTSTDTDLRYIQDVLSYLDQAEQHTSERPRPSTHAEHESAVQQPFKISINNLEFMYPGTDRAALKDISLTIQPGERIALVGANGSGKTTLAKLLLGLYKPTAGTIKINDRDSTNIDFDWWSQQATIVFQDYGRYETSVTENISFGAVERPFDPATFQHAIERSGTDSMIKTLPQQAQTLVGKTFADEAIDLSGGQWQKLALARAYYRNTPIIVLDEPTSALDPQAEVEVYRQFREAVAGRTAVLISHRLGSARLADRIVVLERGQIVETGSYAELMAAKGVFAEMYSLQAAWYQ